MKRTPESHWSAFHSNIGKKLRYIFSLTSDLGVCYLLTTTSLLLNPALKEMTKQPEKTTR